MTHIKNSTKKHSAVGHLPLSVRVNEAGLLSMVYKEAASEEWRVSPEPRYTVDVLNQSTEKGLKKTCTREQGRP